MRKTKFIIICVIAVIFLYIIGRDSDYARITDVEYTAVLVDEPDSYGKVVITERLTFDIHAASKNNLFWELWRDLPEDYVDGAKVSYKVNSVKQILEDGTEIIYEESPKLYWDDYDYVSYNPIYGPGKWYHSEGPYDEENARYECVFFYVDGLYREEVVFEIEYEMYNAALRYNDCSDLYLSLYSEETINYLESFKAQILIPDKDMPSAGNYDVFTYGTNSNDFPVTESDTINPGYHTFSFELDEDELDFKPYNEYIEFDLISYGDDKHIFTEYASYNYYFNDDVLDEIYEEQQEYASTPKEYMKTKTIILIVFSAGALITILWVLTAKARMKSKHIFYDPAYVDYAKEIPSDLDPNFAAALVFCKQKRPKDDSGVYSALLLSLARKKYIELTECTSGDVLITIRKQPAQAPQPTPASNMNFNTYNSSYSTGYNHPASDTYSGYHNYPDNNSYQGYYNYPDNNSYSGAYNSPGSNTYSTGYNYQNTGAYDTGYTYDTGETYEPLTTCEEYYFNLLVRHAVGNTIYMNDLQSRVASDYENTDAFARNIKNSIVNIGVREGYFQKGDYERPKLQMRSSANKFMVFGILLVTLVNIIFYRTRIDFAFGAFFILGFTFILCSIYLKKQANKLILLTEFGENEYAKWRGLYNYLNSEALIHDSTITELPVWEKYLVYATAFGLADKVSNAIGIKCPAVNSSPILSNNYYRSRRFRHHSRSFRSSVRSGSYSARSGGGFGYGGGGRGGGGGGGGH